jgi:hypothetical protein
VRPTLPRSPWLAASLVLGCASVPVSSIALLPEQPPARTAPTLRSRSLGLTWGPTTARAIAQATEGHGVWVSSPAYGAVWLPAQPAGFAPYVTDGQWRITDAGWFWQSALPWGDLAFHYGRWISWGARWAWVPGTQFAPAWVDWRAGNGWVAWAPQAPRGAVSTASFVYCPADAALNPQVARVVVQGAAASSLYPRTQPVAPRAGYLGAVYAFGPAPADNPPATLPLIPAGLATASATAREDLAALRAETAVEPPREIDEVPVAQGVATMAEPTASVDARAPVRIREADLARPGSARVSVISMPYGARAELWRPRPRAAVTAVAPPPPRRGRGPRAAPAAGRRAPRVVADGRAPRRGPATRWRRARRGVHGARGPARATDGHAHRDARAAAATDRDRHRGEPRGRLWRHRRRHPRGARADGHPRRAGDRDARDGDRVLGAAGREPRPLRLIPEGGHASPSVPRLRGWDGARYSSSGTEILFERGPDATSTAVHSRGAAAVMRGEPAPGGHRRARRRRRGAHRRRGRPHRRAGGTRRHRDPHRGLSRHRRRRPLG